MKYKINRDLFLFPRCSLSSRRSLRDTFFFGIVVIIGEKVLIYMRTGSSGDGGSLFLFRLGAYAAGCAEGCEDGRSHRCNDLNDEL